MLTTLKGARAATYYAAMALDAGVADAAAASSVAKAFTGEGVAALAGEALQAHGGIGFTWEHDLHLYLRRAKVERDAVRRARGALRAARRAAGVKLACQPNPGFRRGRVGREVDEAAGARSRRSGRLLHRQMDASKRVSKSDLRAEMAER